MTKLVNNRQVNVWRGSSEPPTIHHLWIKDESTVLIYDEEESRWVPLNEFPGISFQPDPDTGTVIIQLVLILMQRKLLQLQVML